MKPIHWDTVNPLTGRFFTWDDPNHRWGSPSYYLEPGDPGFVPYGPTPGPPNLKKKKPFRRRKITTPATNNHNTSETTPLQPRSKAG
jgi:hypothetical protein